MRTQTSSRTAAQSMARVVDVLRVPVDGMLVGTELLAAEIEAGAPPEVRAIVRSLHSQALWLQNTLESLRATATVQRGGVTLHPRDVDVVALVQQVAAALQPALTAQEQPLRLVLAGAVPVVWADPRWMGHALANLLRSASSGGPPGIPVDVRVEALATGAVRVAVAGRGPGPPDENTGRRFASGSRNGARGALEAELALALRVVRGIVQAHGGSVGTADRPGGGASYWIDLPAREATQDGRDNRSGSG